MKLEKNSNTVLAMTKSKAKMYEFDIDEVHHIDLHKDPQSLLITTIGILGELTAIESRRAVDRINESEELRGQLIAVGQFFDALKLSRLAPDLNDYLMLLGAASYYLGGMPGSSYVLSKDVSYDLSDLTSGYIEGALIWLLKSDLEHDWYYKPGAYLEGELEEFVDLFKGFFERKNDASDFYEAADSLRKVVYECGSDRELLFVDTIVSVAFKKIENSSLNCLGAYSGLDISAWRPALEKPDFIKELWPAQKLLGLAGVLKGVSAVVQMPTSAGKTKSTELIIRSAFLSGRAKLAVIVAPFRALCREISSNFQKAFHGEGVRINELQDTINVDEEEQSFLRFLLGESDDGEGLKTVVVTTPEKLVYMLRHEPALASEIGLLIFDEGHQFDSGVRGVTYELLLASLKSSVPLASQKVLISAVMANAETIGDWLNGGDGIDIQGSNCLPTLKSIAFVSWTKRLGQLQYLDQDNITDSGYFVPRVIEEINLGVRGAERKERVFPVKSTVSSVAAYLGVKLCHQGPVAIFCGAKKSVVTISKHLVDSYKRGLDIARPSEKSDVSELDRMANLAALHFENNTIFPDAIKLGVLPHSSNIPNGLRVSVEWAMERGKGCLVVCTSTLAQGVNLPIKYLVVSSTNQGGKDISTRDFQNLIGRAGRSGHHTEGSIIFADSKIYDKRMSRYDSWRWVEAIHLLSFTNAEDCLSSLKDLVSPFEFGYSFTENDVNDFIANPMKSRKKWLAWGASDGVDVSGLLSEMDSRLELIRSVESYFLSYLKDNPEVESEEVFTELAKQTLAFHLADDVEKELLVQAFELIAERVMSLPKKKYAYYGKALLGVDQLISIEAWIDDHEFELELSGSPVDILGVVWPLIARLSSHKLINNLRPQDQLLPLAQKWIAGASYAEIFKFLKAAGGKCQAKSKAMKLSMDHILDFTTGVLSYDGMLFIGAIADILEGREFDSELVERTRLLQNQLKLGLSDDLEIFLYKKGYVDREVCKALAKTLRDKMEYNNIFDYKILEDNFEDVVLALDAFPSYFLEVYSPRV